MTTPPHSDSNTDSVEIALDKAKDLALMPGKTEQIEVKFKNTGTTVVHLKITIESRGNNKFLEKWCEYQKDTIMLNPGQTRAINFTFKVPREWSSRSADYEVSVVAKSGGDYTVSENATWRILPFENLKIKLDGPAKHSKWWGFKATYNMAVINNSNIPASFALNRSEDDNETPFYFEGTDKDFALNIGFEYTSGDRNSNLLRLEPGKEARVKVFVSTKKAWWDFIGNFIGNPQDYGFEVQAKRKRDDRDDVKINLIAEFTHIRIPWIVVVGVLAGLVALVVWLRQPPSITVFKTQSQEHQWGTPVVLSWKTTGERVELSSFVDNGTGTPVSPYTIPQTGTIPPDINLIAYNPWWKGGTSVEATLLPVTELPTPTSPPTLPPPPPTLSPEPSPPPIPPVITTTVLLTQTVIVTFTNTPVPTVPTPTPTTDIAPTLLCLPGAKLGLEGTGAAMAGYLVFLGDQPVTGEVIKPNGTFSITLQMNQVRPGIYPVTVKLQQTWQPLAITAYELLLSDGTRSPRTTAPDGRTFTLYCKVPIPKTPTPVTLLEPTQTPTGTPTPTPPK